EAEINHLIALLGNGDSGSPKKPPCLEGTRVSLLKWISGWIEEPSTSGERGLCIIGAAGRGKSSVGASVAQQERKLKRLGGEFYFIVDEHDRNEKVVLVLAYQLASWGDRRLRVEIAAAVDEDRSIAQRRLEEQFQKLIREPLETLANDPGCPPLVILVDGLDEFIDERASRLIRLIGQSFATLPPAVRFIITSRPEPHLLCLYDSEPMSTQLLVRSLDLEDVDEVERDIKVFLETELPQMVWGLVEKPSNWPGEKRCLLLIELSGGLWVWIVTVARLLADRNFRDPEKQLNALLSSKPNTLGEYGHNTDLSAIYSKVLNRACALNSPFELLTLFRNVLGALSVVDEPINTHTLASLLAPSSSVDQSVGMQKRVLGYLQAVLIVPDVDEDDPSRDAKPIRFIHKSFRDYLTDPSRCEARFLVDIPEEHRRMAIRCLDRMNELDKPNMCGLDPTLLNEEMEWLPDVNRLSRRPLLDPIDLRQYKPGWRCKGIEDLVRRHISSRLQYACKNWTIHVSKTSHECDDVYASVEAFARTRLLFWLEVLSLMGRVGSVQTVVDWLKARPPLVTPAPSDSPAPPNPSLYRRFRTLIPEGFMSAKAVETCATRTSTSSLPLRTLVFVKDVIAQNLPLRQKTIPLHASTISADSDVSVLSLLQDLQIFVRVFGIPIRESTPHIYLSALAFTPSHTSLSRVYGHLAEGGPKPRRGCAQLWSQHRYRCVAWSPDGQRIVSGSEGGTLCLWDSLTGTPIGEDRKCHSTQVRTLAWSPDGRMIVAGSWFHSTLKRWDPITGEVVGEAWKGHSRSVCSLAWSPDSQMIVSGSDDKTLRLWDPSTGQPVGEAWVGHTANVTCVAWSPDGRGIISGSGDGILRLWDPFTGAPIGEPWNCSTDAEYSSLSEVDALCWSPDGGTIASASADGKLRLWDPITRALIMVFERSVLVAGPEFLAWSPDGKWVIAAAPSELIRWSPFAGEHISTSWPGEITQSVAWSPDREMIIATSHHGVLIRWNVITGEPIRLGQSEPESHSRPVYDIAFAPHSDKIASASHDGTLRLWDTMSGLLARNPVHQEAKASRLAFSLDGKCVVSESEDCQTIWEVGGEGTEPDGDPSSSDLECEESTDGGGWLKDPNGERMFWLPDALTPINGWGCIRAHKNVLAIGIPSVPIIDISAYASRM
ncbi:hypothetical protein FRB95_014249, partial [Tulasnella sp. JGI-2019a]